MKTIDLIKEAAFDVLTAGDVEQIELEVARLKTANPDCILKERLLQRIYREKALFCYFLTESIGFEEAKRKPGSFELSGEVYVMITQPNEVELRSGELDTGVFYVGRVVRYADYRGFGLFPYVDTETAIFEAFWEEQSWCGPVKLKPLSGYDWL